MPRHAAIAGTGRSGTSFLMKFLSACGVPAGNLEETLYFDAANAGHERRVVDADLPYLFKDPALHDYLTEFDELDVQLDALIVPIRDLRSAAASRVVQERMRVNRDLPRGGLPHASSTTAGGVVYSLSVDDQERILAVGQARLLAWAVERDIPLFLLAFPRIITDAEYVLNALWPWLQQFTTRETALAAHRNVADPSKVHVGSAPDLLSEEDLRLELMAKSATIEQLKKQLAGTDDISTSIKILYRLDRIDAALRKSLRNKKGDLTD